MRTLCSLHAVKPNQDNLFNRFIAVRVEIVHDFVISVSRPDKVQVQTFFSQYPIFAQKVNFWLDLI